MKPARPAPGSQLYGVLAISRFVGETEAATLAMLVDGKLPGSPLKTMWTADKAKLREWMAARDAAWRDTGAARRI